jgi:hypothetical protein
MMNPEQERAAFDNPINGRSGFTAALRSTLEQSARLRVRELCLVDVDFEAWPLDDADVLAALTAWARLPLRRMLIVAARYDALPRGFPRFTEWRRLWAHQVEARATDVEDSQIPTLLLAPPAPSLHLADRLRWRGHTLADDREVADWREVVDVLVQRSEPAFGANTLGL